MTGGGGGGGGDAAAVEAAVEEAWVDVLAAIYGKVKWHKIRARSTYDVFEHRIEYSRHERGVPEIVQKLCDKLSIQAPVYAVRRDLFLSRVRELRDHETVALRLIRTRGKMLTLLAAQRAQEMKASDREGEEGEGEGGGEAAAAEGQQRLTAAVPAAAAAPPPQDKAYRAGGKKKKPAGAGAGARSGHGTKRAAGRGGGGRNKGRTPRKAKDGAASDGEVNAS